MLTDLLKNHLLFRRCIIIYVCMMTSYVTAHSVGFAYVSRYDGMETVAVITAMQAPIMALLGYMYKSYNATRADQ